MKRLVLALIGVLALVAHSAAAAPKCEVDRPIIFAGMDWASNAFHNAVAGFIMEKGFGCKVDIIPGSTIPLLTGLARGDVDIAMEIWKDNVTEPWNKALAAGKVVELGTNYPDAVQGWYVPRYLVEGKGAKAPDLRHVRDLVKYKALFRDPEEPSKGRFYNCILGWNCELINTKKLKVYGLDKHFTNFRAGTGAALAAAIASNYMRGKPFVAYYWGPTWVMGKFDLVMLDEPPHNAADWKALGAEKNPRKAVAYPLVEVIVGVNTAFRNQAPKLVEFLTLYDTSNAQISDALSYMQETKGATEKDAALRFLRQMSKYWSQWVPADVAARVRAALR